MFVGPTDLGLELLMSNLLISDTLKNVSNLGGFVRPCKIEGLFCSAGQL